MYGYINKIGNVVLKGRNYHNIKTDVGDEITCFLVDDIDCLDTKNILSCSTVSVPSDKGDIPVINIELSPLKKANTKKIMKSLFERCENKLPSYIQNNMVIRFMDYENGFPLTGSGKRDLIALESMGLNNTYKIEHDGTLVPNVKQENVKKKILT